MSKEPEIRGVSLRLDENRAQMARKKILYVITKSVWGGASRGLLWSAALLRNPRFPTLAPLAAFLHGELPFPDPLPAPPQITPWGYTNLRWKRK